MNDRIEALEEKVRIYERVILDTLWMARRYANGRKSYAPTVINDALGKCAELGILIAPDHTLIEDGNSDASILDT